MYGKAKVGRPDWYMMGACIVFALTFSLRSVPLAVLLLLFMPFSLLSLTGELPLPTRNAPICQTLLCISIPLLVIGAFSSLLLLLPKLLIPSACVWLFGGALMLFLPPGAFRKSRMAMYWAVICFAAVVALLIMLLQRYQVYGDLYEGLSYDILRVMMNARTRPQVLYSAYVSGLAALDAKRTAALESLAALTGGNVLPWLSEESPLAEGRELKCFVCFFRAIPHKERTAKRLGKMYNKEVKKQLTMSLISDELGQASTKKKEFLGIMEKLIPWSQWVGIVQPHYYKGERGNKPYDLELMLRIYVLQHLYNLADDAARNEIIDSRAFSQFCGVDSSNQVPDGDTIGRFRHILEQNQLGEAFFTNVVESLQKCNLMLKKGTIVDSTLIAAPSSTKNKEKQRDPEAHSVKKGNQWYFGYKEHIGVDADSGLVHTVETTSANVHDSNMVVELLQGTEEDVYGDRGYLGAEKKDDAILVNNEGHPIRYQINKRPSQLKKASGEKFELLKAIEHAKSSVRSKVEHVFCVIKRIFHFCKTRYRGREKLHQHCCTLFALANLYLARNRMKVA